MSVNFVRIYVCLSSDGILAITLCHVVVSVRDASTISHVRSLGAAHARQKAACGLSVRGSPEDSLVVGTMAPYEPSTLILRHRIFNYFVQVNLGAQAVSCSLAVQALHTNSKADHNVSLALRSMRVRPELSHRRSQHSAVASPYPSHDIRIKKIGHLFRSK